MKKIILILIFITSSLFAQKGDVDVSINFGTMSGTGFGITYNFTERARVKLDGVFLAYISDSDENVQLYSLGTAFNLDLVQLKDGISTVYALGSFSALLLNRPKKLENTLKVFSLGVGVKKFVGKKLFFEIELGYGYYINYMDDFISMISGNFNLGYRF